MLPPARSRRHLDAVDRAPVCVKGVGRLFRVGEPPVDLERPFDQLFIVGDDQKRLQVDDVQDVVGQECIERSPVSSGHIVLPQEHGKVAIDLDEITTIDAQLFLTSFESPLVSQRASCARNRPCNRWPVTR